MAPHIAIGQWSTLGQETLAPTLHLPIHEESSGTNAHDYPADPGLMAWAMKLPDRPEAADFFQTLFRSPDPFSLVSVLPPDASAIPAGTWQHDEALLMLTASATDEAGARTFADQITGPARRQHAQAIIRRAALLRSMR